MFGAEQPYQHYLAYVRYSDCVDGAKKCEQENSEWSK